MCMHINITSLNITADNSITKTTLTSPKNYKFHDDFLDFLIFGSCKIAPLSSVPLAYGPQPASFTTLALVASL